MGNAPGKLHNRELQLCNAAVQIREIKLDAPHTRIRTPFDADNPKFASKGLVLWARDNPNPVPATVSLGRDVTLTVGLDYNVSGLGYTDKTLLWKLRGTVCNNDRFEIHSETASIGSITKNLNVHVTLRFRGNSDTPWGLKDDVLWSVDVATKAMPTEILHTVGNCCRTSIELYGICHDLVKWYSRPGVPLDMLRIFVLPTSGVASIGDLDDWVKWIVERCHASRFDQDCEMPKEERVHAFRYDVVG